MSHVVMCVSSMENPAEELGQIVAGVNNSRNMLHDNISSFMPFLNSMMLDLDVMCTRSGMRSIDHGSCQNNRSLI